MTFKISYLPNILTLIRLSLIPVIVGVFTIGTQSAYGVCLVLFLVAMATDVLDGRIARRYNAVTRLGQLLDSLTDKLLLNTMLFALASEGAVPLPLAVALFARDIISSEFKSFSATNRVYIAERAEGKIKAFIETVAIAVGLYSLASTSSQIMLSTVATYLLWAALIVGLVGLYRILSQHGKILFE